MTEEIKIILENIKKQNEWEGVEYFRTPLSNEDADKILNCITNLQQDLDKANDIIKKDRQFYKCRMDEYAELKKESEFLKLNNPEMNIEHFRIVKENKRKIDNLRKENKKLKNFITNLISELNHCELNGTKKLDIVSDYIKQEYENILKGND